MLAFYLSVVPMSDDQSDIFVKIYNLYLPFMSKIACKYLTSPQDQEDAVQDAMLAVARNIKKLQVPESQEVKIYVAKVIRSVCVEILRNNNHHAHIASAEDLRDERTDVEGEVAAEDIYNRLVAFIKTLPPQYVDPLTLFIVLELDPQEIAVALGRSVHTVRTQLRRGQQLIRKKFDEVLKL